MIIPTIFTDKISCLRPHRKFFPYLFNKGKAEKKRKGFFRDVILAECKMSKAGGATYRPCENCKLVSKNNFNHVEFLFLCTRRNNIMI